MGNTLKCKSCLRKRKKTEERESQGYSVDRFVKDGLVPVWGYACWNPLDKAKRENIKALLKNHNANLNKRMDKKAKPGAAAINEVERELNKLGTHDPLPLEVVCIVGLWKAEVENKNDKRQSFYFNQEASLRVRVSGSLNFPPDVDPKEPLENGSQAATSKDPNAKKDPSDNRWWLKIDVIAVLKVHEDDAAAAQSKGDSASTRLKVSCEKLDIWNTVGDPQNDMQGDPMVESWLPVKDILSDIEVMLETKLRENIRGLDNQDSLEAN
jgi:hypothetical protein